MLLTEIGGLFFVNTRQHGWSKENFALGKKLLSSWQVRSEEGVGANNSPLEHVAGKLIRT